MRQRPGERMRLLRRREHRGALRERARGRSEVAAALREALGEAAEPLQLRLRVLDLPRLLLVPRVVLLHFVGYLVDRVIDATE